MICTLAQHFSGDQIDKNEMFWACCTYKEEKRCIQGFGWEI